MITATAEEKKRDARRPAAFGGTTTPGHKRSGLARAQERWGWIFAAPAIIGFVVFVLGPMVASFVIGMTDWTIGLPPNFIGLANYQEIFTDNVFYASLRATAYYVILAVPGTIVVAFLAALLLNRASPRGRGVFRTLFYLPVLVPPVASAVVWLWIFAPDNGLANNILRAVGLPPARWIYDEATAVPSIAIMVAWGFGNMALIFLAALQGVSRELLEAAEMDGAGPLRRLWSVTIPQVSPIILFNLITGLIAALQVFDAAYVMTGGGPNYATTFYVYRIYTEAFGNGELGYASALAWILFVVVLAVTVLVFRTARHWVFYEGEAK
jgi:multiple sugar transport system permease protein